MKKAFFPIIVFFTGASALIIEVVGVRILSPYFGNTIISFSCVISVVLGGLSFGYMFGGKLADRRPSQKMFFSIILASGLSVILLRLLTDFFLQILGNFFSPLYGPLSASILLFLLPSFFLGMLSPFAIKLQHERFPLRGIGEISGGIFFWSTVGSIFGSLLTGFVLIPYIGISKIILSVGIILTVGALLFLGKDGLSKKKIAQVAVLALAFLVPTFFPPSTQFVYSAEGVYQKILIFNSDKDGRPTLSLQQDQNLSSGMYTNSDDLVFDYSKYIYLYKIFRPELKQTLVIGAGAYSIPKALLKESPDTRVDVAEIEPSLFPLAKKYFRLPDDPRLTNYTEDGRRFLLNSKKTYDLIFADAYQAPQSIPFHLTTKEFFEIAREHLADKGIFMANVIGSLNKDQPYSFLYSEMRTFQGVFPNSYFFAVDSVATQGVQNIIFIGYNSGEKIDPAKLPQTIIDTKNLNLSHYTELTDDFAPVEFLNLSSVWPIQ